ncbi:hypothetical protein KAW18_02105 [candidate division WOR-3 bacterium]|nr:hypothetical protein [candidate division WOR-3 bacterium]
MNITKRRAEEAEERGRYRESNGSYAFAMVSYANAKQLYEETKDTEKLKDIINCIKRVENLLIHQDEIEIKN